MHLYPQNAMGGAGQASAHGILLFAYAYLIQQLTIWEAISQLISV